MITNKQERKKSYKKAKEELVIWNQGELLTSQMDFFFNVAAATSSEKGRRKQEATYEEAEQQQQGNKNKKASKNKKKRREAQFECIEETQHFFIHENQIWMGFFLLSLSLSSYIYMTFHPFIPHLWMNEKNSFLSTQEAQFECVLGKLQHFQSMKTKFGCIFYFIF